MAISAQEIIIDLEINDKGSAKSLNELEQRLVNLKDALKDTAIGSDDFKKLKAEVIKADAQVKNLNKSIEGLDTEAMAGEIGKFGGGITAAFTGVAALVGNSSEEFEKFTKNIVTGIAVAQGFKGATEAYTAAQKLAIPVQRALNAAYKANPIGLTIAAVAALAAGIVYLVTVMGDYTEEGNRTIKMQKDLDTIMDKSTQTVFKLQIELANLNEQYQKSADLQQALFEKEKLQDYNDLLVETKNRFIEQGEAAGKNGGIIQQALEDETQLIGEKAVLEERLNRVGSVTLTAAGKKRLQDKIDNIEKEIDANEIKYTNLINQDEIYLTKQQSLDKKYALEQEVLNKKLEKENNDRLAAALEARKKFLDDLITLEQKYIDELKGEKDLYIETEKKFALQLIGLNQEIYDKELALLVEREKQDMDSRNRSRKDRMDGFKKEQADILKIKVEDLNNEKKFNAAIKRLSNEELATYTKVTSTMVEIRLSILKNQLASEVSLNSEILQLQIDRRDAFIDVVKEIKSANEMSSANMIDNVRKRNLKIIDLNNALITNGIVKEIQENEKLNESYKKRLETLDEQIKYANESLVKVEAALVLEKEKFNLTDKELKARRDAIDVLKLSVTVFEKQKEIITDEVELINKGNIALAAKLGIQGKITKSAKEAANLAADESSLQALVQINNRKLELVKGQWKKERDLKVENLSYTTQLEFNTLDKIYKSGAIITEDYELAKKDIEDKFRKEKIELELEGYIKLAKVGQKIFGDFQTILLNQSNARVDAELQKTNDKLDAEVKALDGAVNAGIETEESKNDKLEQIDRDRAKAQRKAAYDKAKSEKSAALVKIAIETAIAVVEAAPVIPLQLQAAALGTSQAAVVASQPLPQLKRGGRINGPSHENGGVPLYKNGSKIAEVEGDELIMTKGVAQSPALLMAASALNEAAGGVSFTNKNFTPSGGDGAGTGSMVAVIDEASLARVMNSITSIPVVNIASKTGNIDRKVKNIESKSTFWLDYKIIIFK